MQQSLKNPWEAFDLSKGQNPDQSLEVVAQLIHDRLAGRVHPERFKSFRLNYGIYGVRHHDDGMHMLRLKIPGGLIFSEQLRQIAELTSAFVGSGCAHITTRQDIQLHYVRLEDVLEILENLAAVGITTKGACGNSARNVTASAYSGICPEEVFDVLPHAVYMTRHILYHPLNHTLPRKFKIAFSECEKDHALVRINDIGAVAARRGRERGFRVYLAGGLSFNPFLAEPFEDFLPEAEIFPLAEAVLRVFHKYGDKERENRSHARLKYLFLRVGKEQFEKWVREEYAITSRNRSVVEDWKHFLNQFPTAKPSGNGRSNGQPNPLRRKKPTYPIPSEDPLFKDFKEQCLIQQKQKGYSALVLKPPLGNLTPEELRSIAQLADAYGEGYLQLTIDQNVILPWTEDRFAYDLFTEVRERGFYDARRAARNIVSCPGAYSCRLAITHPYNLTTAIGENLNDTAGLRIHISGCPNACGQHQVGDIGFYGAALKVKDKLAPHYILLLGGNPTLGHNRLAEPFAKIPVHNASTVVQALVNFYREERKNGELFYQLLERVGKDVVRRLIAPYTKIDESTPYTQEPGIDEDFKMEAESRGECAGSTLDLVAVNLFEAQRNMYECEDHLRDGDFEKVREKSLAAIELCCKMFLEMTQGTLSKEASPLDIVLQFEETVVPKSSLCHDFTGITEDYLRYRDAQPTEKNIQQLYELAKVFVKDCDDAFLRIKPDLQIAECTKKLGHYS